MSNHRLAGSKVLKENCTSASSFSLLGQVFSMIRVAGEGFQQRLPKLMARGIGKAGEFELNLGKNIAHL
jgi:hypothetical protein